MIRRSTMFRSISYRVTEHGSGVIAPRRTEKTNYVYEKWYRVSLYCENPMRKTGTTQNQSDGWFMGMVPNGHRVWVEEDRSIRFGKSLWTRCDHGCPFGPCSWKGPENEAWGFPGGFCAEIVNIPGLWEYENDANPLLAHFKQISINWSAILGMPFHQKQFLFLEVLKYNFKC